MAPYLFEFMIFQVLNCLIQKERRNISSPEFRHNKGIIYEAVFLRKFYYLIVIQNINLPQADFYITYYFIIMLYVGENVFFRFGGFDFFWNIHPGV